MTDVPDILHEEDVRAVIEDEIDASDFPQVWIHSGLAERVVIPFSLLEEPDGSYQTSGMASSIVIRKTGASSGLPPSIRVLETLKAAATTVSENGAQDNQITWLCRVSFTRLDADGGVVHIADPIIAVAGETVSFQNFTIQDGSEYGTPGIGDPQVDGAYVYTGAGKWLVEVEVHADLNY